MFWVSLWHRCSLEMALAGKMATRCLTKASNAPVTMFQDVELAIWFPHLTKFVRKAGGVGRFCPTGLGFSELVDGSVVALAAALDLPLPFALGFGVTVFTIGWGVSDFGQSSGRSSGICTCDRLRITDITRHFTDWMSTECAISVDKIVCTAPHVWHVNCPSAETGLLHKWTQWHWQMHSNTWQSASKNTLHCTDP